MNLTDDEVLKFQKGTPILFKDICAIYSRTVGDIVDIGYTKFQQYLGLLTATKPLPKPTDDEEVKQLLETITDFEYILMMAFNDLELNTLMKEAFDFFTHETVIFSLEPAQIIIGPAEEGHIIHEADYYDFQRILRRMYFLEQEGEEIIIDPDDSPAVRRLKLQMRENREKVRRAKAKQAEREKSDLKFSDLIGSITINNCGLNMINIYDITYYAFHDQLKRMGWRDQFDINNRAALAGAKLKKNELKHWMRSIANSDKS
jgi:hypothetical protein